MSVPRTSSDVWRKGEQASASSASPNLSNNSTATRSRSSSAETDSTHLGAIRFGTVKTGERRLRSFSFVNPGPMELQVVELTLSPQHSSSSSTSDCAHFSILRAPTLPHNMRPHETCKCVVSFHPSSDCSPSAILAIVPAGNHPRQHVELSGTGVTASPVPRSLPSVSEEQAVSQFPGVQTPSQRQNMQSPCTPGHNGPCADSLPVTTPMRIQHHQALTSPCSGAPMPQIPKEHVSPPPPEGSPEEVAWLRRRVSRLEKAFRAYATEIARHNAEVAKVFAALSNGGDLNDTTPGKISMADIAGFERCDEWEAFAARESEGTPKANEGWATMSPAKSIINVNEIMDIPVQKTDAYRTPLAVKPSNLPEIQSTDKRGPITTPGTPMMAELPLDALDEVGGPHPDKGFTPPPSAMKFCPPPVTPSMHSLNSIESAACN